VNRIETVNLETETLLQIVEDRKIRRTGLLILKVIKRSSEKDMKKKDCGYEGRKRIEIE
jgi:hypothetical protein